MHFVDDENLVAVPHGTDRQPGNDDVAHVLDLRVGRRIDLEDIHVAAFRDLNARIARAAGIRRRSVHAVQRPGENPRRRRLADAARTGEDERLREPLAAERVAQRTRHRLLSDDVVELLRPPFSRDDLI